MSILAEEIVEEWLNRKGYFTIRGIKIEVDEIDLVAIKPDSKGNLECRHIEVQASIRPVSYISRVPKEIQKKTGRSPNSVKRSSRELIQGVKEWVEKKYKKENKLTILKDLAPGPWSRELVLHKVKSEKEVELIKKQKILVHRLSNIANELKGKDFLKAASGGNLVELLHLIVSDK